MAEAHRTGDEQTFGALSLRFLEPTLAVATFRDPMLAEDVYAMITALRAVREQHGRLFFLADVTAISSVPLDIHSLGPKALLRYNALALISSSFSVRVSVSMVMRAARFLHKERFHFPVEYFKTEAEGLAWLRERADA